MFTSSFVVSGSVQHPSRLLRGALSVLLGVMAITAPGGPRAAGAQAPPVVLKVTDYTEAAAFTADGKRLIGSDQTRNQYVWDTANWQKIATVAPADRMGLVQKWAMSPDGSIGAFFVGAKIDVYDIAQAKQLGTLVMDVRSLAVSPDGRLLAVGTHHTPTDAPSVLGVMILDARTLQRQSAFDLRFPPTALAFSPDGKTLAWAGSETGRAVELLDAGTGKPLGKFGQSGDIRHVAFSPDGKAIACAGPKYARWWTIDGSVEGPAPELAGGQRIAFSPSGKTVAIGGRTTALLDRTTGKQVRQLRVSGDAKSLSFSPDGKYLAIAVGQTVRVYTLE